MNTMNQTQKTIQICKNHILISVIAAGALTATAIIGIEIYKQVKRKRPTCILYPFDWPIPDETEDDE